MPIILSRKTGSNAINASRYMRIVGLPVRDQWYTVAELEVATSAGGSNIMGSATVSSPDFSSTVANIKDGNNTTEWIAQLLAGWTTQGSVIVDFGSAINPFEIRIRAINSTVFWRTVRCFAVHLSNDSGFSTYQVAGMFSTADWTQNEIRTFVLASTPLAQTRAAARAWRVRITANNGNGSATSMGETIWASSAGGSQIMTGGTAFHGFMFGSGPSTSLISANLFDGDTSTPWVVGNAGPVFAGYLSPSPVTVAQVRIAPRTGFLTEAPRDGAVEWSNDLLNWNSAATFTGLTGWADGVYQNVAVP